MGNLVSYKPGRVKYWVTSEDSFIAFFNKKEEILKGSKTKTGLGYLGRIAFEHYYKLVDNAKDSVGRSVFPICSMNGISDKWRRERLKDLPYRTLGDTHFNLLLSLLFGSAKYDVDDIETFFKLFYFKGTDTKNHFLSAIKIVKLLLDENDPKYQKNYQVKESKSEDGEKRLIILVDNRTGDPSDILPSPSVPDIGNKPEEVPGTTIINEAYYQDTKKAYSFTKSQFYTAKLDPRCQWYGIIEGFDITRKEYESVKKVALESFQLYRTLKVSAVVSGDGGCGKSTLLRWLAIDLKDQEFVVLWVNEREFTDFVTQGLSVIKEHTDVKFLVIIEDWYRLTNDTTFQAKTFLNDTRGINNIRLIIGDRVIKPNVYKNLNNTDHDFPLGYSENRTIIDKILLKSPEWSQAASHIFQKEANYNTTLFLLLFILVRYNEEISKGVDIDWSEPKSAFKNIITSDLKVIAEVYPGLAKMLFYWGSMYAKDKMFISYSCFLQLADYFNGNKEVSFNCSNLSSGRSNIYEKLRIYLNVGTLPEKWGRLETVQFLQFNHDILADEGIAKLKAPFLGGYDDPVKMVLLKRIPKIKGSDYSASVLLSIMIKNDRRLFESDEQWLKYINKLIDNKNKFYGYLNQMNRLDVPFSVLEKQINKLKKEGLMPVVTWVSYIKKYKSKASEVLLSPELLGLPHKIVSMALKVSDKPDEIQAACTAILTSKRLLELPHDIVTTALKVSDEPDKACTTILTSDKLLELSHHIVTTALKVSDEPDEIQAACTAILTSKKLLELPPDIVTTALKVSDEPDEIQAACTTILTSDKLLELPPEIVTTALKVSDEPDKACTTILTSDKLLELHPHIVTTALKVSDEPDEIQAACTTILTSDKLLELPPEIVTTALKVSDEIQAACTAILTSKRLLELPPDIVTTALKVSDKPDEIQAACTAILTSKRLLELPHDIVTTALKVSDEPDKACTTILTSDKLLELSHHIVTTALKVSDEPDKACTTILTSDKLLELPYQIVSTALRMSDNENLKKEKALFYLKSKKTKNWSVIVQSLHIYSREPRLPKELTIIVQGTIDDYFNHESRNKDKAFKYITLMKIPLHSNTSWKIKSQRIIRNWKTKNDRSLIMNVLVGYRRYPQEIQQVCKDILNDWKKEVVIPIPRYIKNEVSYGNHIHIAMGHPSLRDLTKQVALEMKNADQGIIPEHLQKIVNNILGEDKFPEWNVD